MFKNPKLLKIAKLYNKIINDFKVDKVYMVINELESRNITFQIAQIDELNFKASLFHLGNKEGLIEDSVVFDIKVVMKNKI